MIDLTICIVNTDNIRFLKPCLQSIFQHTQGIAFEVIVVDNNSTDSSVEVVQLEFPQVRLVISKVTKGFSANMNMALREARGRYVVILNDDTLLLSNAFAETVAFMDANPQYGTVGLKLLNEDRSFQIGPRGPATIWTLLPWEFSLDQLFPRSRLFSAFRMTYWDPSKSCEMQTASGACMLIRKAVLEQVGLLDERISLGPDDVELSYRIRKAGWKLYYLASQSLIHYGEVSKVRAQAHSMTRMYKGFYWYLGHHFGWPQANLFRLFTATGAFMRIVGWLFVYLGIPRKRSRALDRMQGRWGIFRLSLSPHFKKIVMCHRECNNVPRTGMKSVPPLLG
jgi:GT2 family glycosyltransferase